MEPWSGLQCASAVLSFVSFAGSLVSGASKVYSGSSGLGPTVDDLRQVALSLTRIKSDFDKLTSTSSKTLSSNDTQILEQLHASQGIADGLLSSIDNICRHGEDGPTVWSSVREALQTIWSADELKVLEARLHQSLNQLHMLMSEATL
jgi:hypothetical protein